VPALQGLRVQTPEPPKKDGKKKKTQEERKGLENVNEAGRWWLTPIILATWKAEIRRIAV
jgi:hypothetical protein